MHQASTCEEKQPLLSFSLTFLMISDPNVPSDSSVISQGFKRMKEDHRSSQWASPSRCPALQPRLLRPGGLALARSSAPLNWGGHTELAVEGRGTGWFASSGSERLHFLPVLCRFCGLCVCGERSRETHRDHACAHGCIHTLSFSSGPCDPVQSFLLSLADPCATSPFSLHDQW